MGRHRRPVAPDRAADDRRTPPGEARSTHPRGAAGDRTRLRRRPRLPLGERHRAVERSRPRRRRPAPDGAAPTRPDRPGAGAVRRERGVPVPPRIDPRRRVRADPQAHPVRVARGPRTLARADRGRTAPRVRGGARVPPRAGGELRSELGPLDDHGRELAGEAAARLASGGRRAVARGDLARRQHAPRASGRPHGSGRSGARSISSCASARHRSMPATSRGRGPRSTRHRRRAPDWSDRRLEIRARLARLALRRQFEPEGATELLKREAETAIPVLEELGDDEGLARAWSALATSA